jgi:peroxiredoxin
VIIRVLIFVHLFFSSPQFPNLKGETQSSTNFDLYEYLGDSWAVVMMHPGDFTPGKLSHCTCAAFDDSLLVFV